MVSGAHRFAQPVAGRHGPERQVERRSMASSVASSSFSPNAEELDAVVVVRIVRGRDDDTAIRAHRMGETDRMQA
jgi:hypothetical protein